MVATRPRETVSSPVPGALSAELRWRTREAHASAEQSLDLGFRLSGPAPYRALLIDLRRFHAALEEALDAVPGWWDLTPPVDLAGRRRARLLDDDLAALDGAHSLAALDGAHSLAEAAGRPPPAAPDALLELGSLARGLGCLYVLEGSALGGRIIACRARASLGAAVPVAFFTGSGRRHPAAQWRELQQALDGFGCGAGPAARRASVAAARQTFAALGACLDHGRPRT